LSDCQSQSAFQRCADQGDLWSIRQPTRPLAVPPLLLILNFSSPWFYTAKDIKNNNNLLALGLVVFNRPVFSNLTPGYAVWLQQSIVHYRLNALSVTQHQSTECTESTKVVIIVFILIYKVAW